MSTRLFRFHRRVISPDERGAGLFLARRALCVPAMLYRLAARTRNELYRTGLRKIHRAAVPVISVGNITAGGTGKTPTAAWLARLLKIHKMRPAILSRGYGAPTGSGVDDENAMLARMAGGVPIVVNPDRVAGAATAVANHGADVLVLDDGFQHRRIARDLDIVLLDALWPFGAGWPLPRGLLREPPSGLRRADFVIIMRANLVSTELLERIKERLRRLAPGVPLACCAVRVRGLRRVRSNSDEPMPPRVLTSGPWWAFCGIANPEGFRATLRHAGCALAGFTVFADHARYVAGDLRALGAAAAEARCAGILTTEKDAVKIEDLLAAAPDPPIFSLRTELDFTEGGTSLTSAILRAAGKAPQLP